MTIKEGFLGKVCRVAWFRQSFRDSKGVGINFKDRRSKEVPEEKDLVLDGWYDEFKGFMGGFRGFGQSLGLVVGEFEDWDP
jgi:hypothetical protein